jgi:hypothetical protein
MRVVFNLVLPTLFLVNASCGGQPAPLVTAPTVQSRDSPTWVLLTIDSARIAQKPNGETWDAADTTPTIKDTAENLASLLSFATQEGGMVAQALASLIPEAQPDSDVTLPDPRVSITYNETVANRHVQSPRAIDTLQPTWGYAFFARTDNLRDSGLDLEVVDDDDGRQERIALVNVARSLLQQVATSGVSQTLQLSDAALEQLRVRVEPVAVHVPTAVQHFALPLRQGLIATHVVVPRGAVVTVRVSGAGKVGSGGFLGLGCPTDVTPAGLAEGKCRDHNLSGMPELQSSAHGSAIALIGTAPDIHAISLANGDAATTCVTFAAPAYGELVFATNDRDSTDNEGEFTFDLEVAPPPEPPTEVSESPMVCR